MIEKDFVPGQWAENKDFRCTRSMDNLMPLTLAHFTRVDYGEIALAAVIKNKRRLLMQCLMAITRDRGIGSHRGAVLLHHSKMLCLCDQPGFRSVQSEV